MSVKIDRANSIEINDLSTIYITGGGFVRKAFNGIGVESPMGWNETVWASNLTRSNTFSLENIDDVDIGQVTQCHIVFPYMNVRDFIDLQKILKERYVMVDFYNVDIGKRETREMAITNNERKKIYNFGNSIIGMTNISVKFVATNRDIEYNNINIYYYANGGEGIIDSINVNYSEQVRLSNGNGLTNGNMHIKEWNTKPDGTGQRYGLNQSITAWQGLDLYAIWE